MPEFLRYLGPHTAAGFALGIAFAALLLLSNVGNLRDLLAASSEMGVALGALLTLCGLTFAAVVTGAAIMTLPERSRNRRG